MPAQPQRLPSPPAPAGLDGVFAVAIIGMAVVRPDGRLVQVNAALLQLLGLAGDKSGTEFIDDLLPGSAAGALRAAWSPVAAGDQAAFEFETQFTTPRGKTVWAHVHGSRLPDGSGHLLLQVQDISGRKADTARLRRSEDRFRSVFQQHFQFMVLLAPDGRVMELNDVIDTAGLPDGPVVPRSEVLGQYFWDTAWWRDLPEMRAAWPSRLRAAAAAQGPVFSEDLFNNADGALRIAQAAITAIRDESGAVEFFVVQATDITERKRAEAKIAQLNAELEGRVRERTAQLRVANMELESFSYSIAHDLRAPLSAIDGFSHLLEKSMDGQQAEKPRHYLARIRAGVKQMGDLTDALLSLAHVSRIELQVAPVDLSQLAHEVLQQCAEREPGRIVHTVVQPGMTVVGDPRLLRQVMANLIGNAWKFTGRQAKASIEVGSMVWADGAPVWFVRDNGVGFDMAYAQKLFGAFQRLHAPREFTGTGIGLANVHRIVARHGGRIWAEAVPDEGATFYFRLGPSGAVRPLGETAGPDV
jgi:PAS domain S-box-containing protein